MRDAVSKGREKAGFARCREGKPTRPMNRLLSHVMTLIRVIVSQGVVLGGIVLYARMGGTLPFGLPVLLLIQGLLAALLGRLLGLWLFWVPLQILLPFALAYGQVVPAWVYAAGFAASVLVFWNGTAEQVPFYMTNRRTFAAIAGLVTEAKAKSVVDLGSGMGGIVTYLASRDPAIRVDGVETAPLLIMLSKGRLLLSRLANARILYRSLWETDLSQYDLVYCFLSPVPMARLYEKAKREMRPGTLLVSNSFEVPDVTPDRIITVDDARQTQLIVYTL